MGKKWILPLSCFGLVILSVLPPYTQVAYDPRHTQDVIYSILSISILPYQSWGWVFHVATLLLIAFILWKPEKSGRVLAGYISVNYLAIAALQTHAVTERYGFALQTGALLGTLLMAIIWLVAAIKDSLHLSLLGIPRWKYFFLPLALLVFWSPIKIVGTTVYPGFDPRLLITSGDYGLTYCFATPVFLYLLILFSTNLTSYTFRLTAFNALLYALFNLVHWFSPNTVWMGVMHLPLLLLSLVALIVPYLGLLSRRRPALRPT